MTEFQDLNIHEKILKIADAAGVLQKTKEGYNYKYVPEEEIQAKVTACMQKYGVMLYPSLVPGTLTVEPYSYQKPKTKTVKDEKGRNQVVIDYMLPVNEVIVKAEVSYLWVNTDKPDDKMECNWAYIGQMEDASQAFGAGATYGNRYFLMKALQLATTEADPDNYRSKQKEAENYEEDKRKKEATALLKKSIADIKQIGTELITQGIPKDKIQEIVAKHNDGSKNPNSIASAEVCEAILAEFNALTPTDK